MKQSTLTFGLLTAAFGCTALAGSTYAFDGVGKESHQQYATKRGHSSEVREQVKASISNNDYVSYSALAQTHNLKRVMNEEQFTQRHTKMIQHQQARQAALDGDYETWRSLVGDERMNEVNSDNFYLLTDLAQARESEDKEAMQKARAALKEAGIKRPHKGYRAHGRDKRHKDGPNFAQRYGFDKQSVSQMSESEKQNMLDTIMNQIKTRLGLN